jgi:hypothetical protein
VRFAAIVHCSKCKQPIVSGQGFGYVCFKIPGEEGYHFFHRRFRTGDCWDDFLRESRERNDSEGLRRLALGPTF